MNRRQILLGALPLLLMPAAALAQTAEDQVIGQLKRQGYRRIEVFRTLLGRTRIVASGPDGRREIVLNPSTGAILRDYTERRVRRDDKGGSGSNSGSGSGGSVDDDDVDDDDEDDDEDDDDNSGKGSSNSGSGSSNSGSGSGNSGKGSDDDDDDDDDDD